jgi:integrase
MNANRARHQTRTDETVARYLRRADGLLCRMADEMQLPEDAYPAPADVVDYLRRNAGEWKWSTFRQYQASLACLYENEYKRTGNQLFVTTADSIRGLASNNCKAADEIGRTSSRKRKGIPKRDYDLLVTNLANPAHRGDWSRRTAVWLMAALATGLRPCEWETACLTADNATLVVKNAKATNGRATGETRSIPVPQEHLRTVRVHIASLRHLFTRGLSFSQIHNRCAEALRRACKATWGTDPSKRYALYSARHQFAANSKAIASPSEVATLLGHRSVRTARTHYAARRSAWPAFKAAPKPMPQKNSTPKPYKP